MRRRPARSAWRRPTAAFPLQPLTVSAQLGLILPLQAWFKWLTKQNHILYNPAADLDLPTRPKALPKGLLSVSQVEDVLNGCDTAMPDARRKGAVD